MRVKIREIILIVFFFGLIISFANLYTNLPSRNMKIFFLDVGQGDATFIETPSRKKILIDGGPNNKVSTELGKILSPFNTKIDIVFATHDDLDHVFGLVKVLEKNSPDFLFVSVASSTNELMQKLLKISKEKNIQIINVTEPMLLTMGDGVFLKILFPITNMNSVSDGNAASIVTQIIYGNKKILLTGDLPISGEDLLIKLYNNNLQSNILKLGHHGSDTSSSADFLRIVSPEFAIVSAGIKNDFGHPHQSVINLVNGFGVKLLETGKEGTIKFIIKENEIDFVD